MALLRAVTRYLKPSHWSIAATSATYVVGTVYLEQIEVPFDCYVDGIIITNSSTVSGNVRAGIYGPVAFNTEDPSTSSLVVESASVAHANANASQTIALTETFLRKGKYYLAFQMDNTTGTVNRHANVRQVTGWTGTYVRAGTTYGAFTDPCPTYSDTATNMPALILRISR